MVADFIADYNRFLDAAWDALDKEFAGRTAKLGPELACVGIGSRGESLAALEIASDCFGRAFPKLLELPEAIENPIGIALSLSKAKHPFFDHWRFLEEPPPDASVQVVGSGRARFRLCDRQRVSQAIKGAKRNQLHRLAAAATVSEALGGIVLREQEDRGIVLRELSALVPAVLDLESARILANLMEG